VAAPTAAVGTAYADGTDFFYIHICNHGRAVPTVAIGTDFFCELQLNKKE
jgi:hypothetical protein